MILLEYLLKEDNCLTNLLVILNRSEELFKIYKINKSNVITYQLKDMNDEIIKGIFYERELQLSKNTTEEYIIEKILKTKGNNIFVKWRGYSNNFNSWVNKYDIKKYL